MTFHHKKHIFFDLDHTLWDFDKNSALTFKKIFELNNLEIDLTEFLEVYVPIAHALANHGQSTCCVIFKV